MNVKNKPGLGLAVLGLHILFHICHDKYFVANMK